MRRLLALCALVSACGGTADPCDGKDGACVTLTVSSATVSRVDTLALTAFGATRTSMRAALALPVTLALIPPAGTAPGDYALDAVASLAGVAVGKGSATITVGAGRTAASLVLVDVSGLSCKSPTPDPCGGVCVDLQSDPKNCKSCGTACDYAHAGATCAQGACQIGACESGYADCANGPTNGCETYAAGDEANCGGCGMKCLVGQICSSSKCVDNIPTCDTPGITCAQKGCTSGHFAVSKAGGIAVDMANGRRLWTRATRGPSTYSDAKFECLGLSLEGISGWRLPSTYSEVPQYMTGGLNGCPVCHPAIDQAAFPDTMSPNPGYWTAEYSSRFLGYLYVDYCDGRSNYADDGTGMHPYRCTHDPL